MRQDPAAAAEGAGALSRRRLLRALPLILWLGVLFFLSHQPGSSLPPEQMAWPFGWLFVHSPLPPDKAAHFLLYFILAVCGNHAGLPGRFNFALAFFYGISDEYHQSFIPGRSCDIFDLAADATGALAAVLVCGSTAIRQAAGSLMRKVVPAPSAEEKDTSPPR